jgi:hypothetical protein
MNVATPSTKAPWISVCCGSYRISNSSVLRSIQVAPSNPDKTAWPVASADTNHIRPPGSKISGMTSVITGPAALNWAAISCLISSRECRFPRIGSLVRMSQTRPELSRTARTLPAGKCSTRCRGEVPASGAARAVDNLDISAIKSIARKMRNGSGAKVLTGKASPRKSVGQNSPQKKCGS